MNLKLIKDMIEAWKYAHQPWDKKCYTCGYGNIRNAVYCGMCGTELNYNEINP